MADFEQDGGTGNSVNSVYIAVLGKPLLEIFPTKYNQKNHCTMIGSPSEMGLTQFDNKVIQPTTVEFTGIVKHSQLAVVRAIRKVIKLTTLKNLICQFQSKAGDVDNMILESIEEIGESNRFDGVEVQVRMQEYLEHNVAK